MINNEDAPKIGEGFDLLGIVQWIISNCSIEAVIFDLDGTICATEFLQYFFYNRVLGFFGVEYTTKEDHFRRNSKNYEEQFIPFLEAKLLKKNVNTISAEEIVSFCAKFVRTTMLAQGKRLIRPGVFETLKYIKDQGLKLGIASLSSMDTIEEKMKTLEIQDFFEKENLISREDVQERKPNPECYLKILEKLQIAPSSTLVVEDTNIGLIAAKAAGCKSLCYFDDSEIDTQFADYFVGSTKKEIVLDDPVNGFIDTFFN